MFCHYLIFFTNFFNIFYKYCISWSKMINQRLFRSPKKIIHHMIFGPSPCYINSIRYTHTLECTSKVETYINKQIKAEHEASQTYLKLSVNFLHPCVSRQGIGCYFMSLHIEELKHMHRLIQYQLMRGCHPIIGGIQAPKIESIHTICQGFELSLQVENDVTTLLKDLVKVAESEGDYHCADFITANFLLEQLQSTNELLHHLTNLRRISDNEHALYNYDKGLLKKFAYIFDLMNN